MYQVQPRTLEDLKDSIWEVLATITKSWATCDAGWRCVMSWAAATSSIACEVAAIAIAWLEWYPECRCYLLLRCCKTCYVVSFSLPTVCCSSLFVPTLRTCCLLLQLALFVEIEPCFCRFFSPFRCGEAKVDGVGYHTYDVEFPQLSNASRSKIYDQYYQSYRRFKPLVPVGHICDRKFAHF